MVSAAICRGPGMAALRICGAAGMALAVVGGTIAAAAPATPAPLRKLRRLESAKRRRFDMTPPLQWNSPREKSAELSVDQIVAAAVVPSAADGAAVAATRACRACCESAAAAAIASPDFFVSGARPFADRLISLPSP